MTDTDVADVKKSQEKLDDIARQVDMETRGVFDIDSGIDPPQTRTLQPGEVDYLRRKLSSKIRACMAYRGAKKFLNNMLKIGQIQIKDIIGLENLQSVKSGAIITCNHFSAFDSFATQVMYERAKLKHKRFYRVIREGNYTDFPGLFGFIMRNYNTLPLSENKRVMVEFMRAVDTLLKRGHLVLVYPEQSLWWNYRKPKPLKDGAFKMAVRSNVPVVPVFITMEDSDVLDPDGFPVQKYTIHVDKPIYPDETKSNVENTESMKNTNYKVWKDIYEKTYNTPLTYLCDKE